MNPGPLNDHDNSNSPERGFDRHAPGQRERRESQFHLRPRR